MSNDPEQEYFSDGMTEELIGALAKLEGLKVISRTSAFHFKGKDTDLRTIGEKLKVENVLEGSVRKDRNKLRISAQLIKVEDDTHLWTETFDREMIDVFFIQEEISRAIVDKLKIKLLREEKGAFTKSTPKNLEAHDYYLRGLFFMKKGGQGFSKATEYFEKAISIDPNFALPYAHIAQISTFSAYAAPIPPRESYQKAKGAAMKALEIDNSIPEAYVSLGLFKMSYEHDWNGAESAFKQAIELNPSHSGARRSYSSFLLALGRKSEALEEMKYAWELDPLAIQTNVGLGVTFTFINQYDQAIKQLQKTLEMVPNEPFVLAQLGVAYVEKGMYGEAIGILEKGVKTFQKHTFLKSTLGYAYGVAGKKDEAQKIVSELLEMRKRSYFSPCLISRIYQGMDDKDKAFEWLNKAYEERDPTLAPIKTAPSCARLRSDPRWTTLMEKMGLPD